jgi:hypothetical protein
VPDAQRYEVSPAVILEVANRLTTTLDKIVRQSRTLPKEPRGAEFTEVQQRFAEVEQYRFDSRFRILDSRSPILMNIKNQNAIPARRERKSSSQSDDSP